jgi:hypothetical protein
MKKPKFRDIMKERNIHSTFLNQEGIEKALENSYNSGVSDVLSWILEMEHLCPNIRYIIDEWNNQHEQK